MAQQEFGGAGAFSLLLAVQAASISGDFPVGGNDIDIFEEADDLFARMAEDIDRAEQHVHIEFYIALEDPTSARVFAALERAALRGVACRMLLDGIGSRALLTSERHSQLRAAGVRVVEALPVGMVRRRFGRIDLRNHRKIVVIDRHTGYIGSHNLAAKDFKVKERYAPWIDATMRVSGPAANDLQKIFVEDCYLETDESLLHFVGDSVRDGSTPAMAQVLGAVEEEDRSLADERPEVVSLRLEPVIASPTGVVVLGASARIEVPAVRAETEVRRLSD